MYIVCKLLKPIFFAFCFFAACFLSAHSIVYVHIGPALPEYLPTTIEQARLFNKECPIYLIANQRAIESYASYFDSSNVTFISCESLSLSSIHQNFHNNAQHDWGGNGFWVYTTERFFYLEEFIREYQLSDVFHFENDIMLYVNLSDLLPIFQKHYKGMIGATFENDNRCVPGFVYISHLAPLTSLIECFPKHVDMSQTDMETFAIFKERYHKILIDYLPIVLPEYAKDHSLKALSIEAKDSKLFFNHFDEFNSIFDAAAFGVYLGGMDSTFHADEHSAAGKIDPYCVFNPSYFSFDWKLDVEGRRVPYITYHDHQVRINNLHITNKPKIPYFFSLAGN